MRTSGIPGISHGADFHFLPLFNFTAFADGDGFHMAIESGDAVTVINGNPFAVSVFAQIPLANYFAFSRRVKRCAFSRREINAIVLA